MKPEELDQFFQRKLGEQPLKSPGPGDWSSARKLLKQKRDRRPLVFWWLVALSVVAGLAYLVSQNPEVPIEEAPKIESLPPMASDDRPQMPNNETQLPVEKESLTGSESDLAQTGRISKEGDYSKLKSGAAEIVLDSSSESDANASPSDQTTLVVQTTEVPLRGEDEVVLSETEEGPATDNTTSLSEPLAQVAGLDFNLQYRYPFDNVNPEDETTIFRTRKIRKTQYGWTASLLMNPANTVGNPVQGLLAGFVAEYPFAQKWTLGVRPSVEVTMNENGYSQFQIQTKYSFNAVNETYGLQATSLQFVRVPLYLGWQLDKHSVEGGIAVAWLLSARGQVQQVQIDGSEVQLLNRFSSGWIETNAMKQFSSNIFFGYKFALNPNMKTGITIFYQPGRIYPGIPGSATLNGDRKWSMGLQALYYLR